MDKRQNVYLLLGMGCFACVIYLSSIHRTSLIPFLENKEIETTKKRSNIVFVLTDDQDSVMESLTAMKNVNSLLMDKGIVFSNSFVASPLCCPSRSSILTGQYVHNHHAVNNSISGGCSSRRWQKGPEKRSFAAALKSHGYRTFFAGKYLNQYGKKEAGGIAHVPPGWDWWIGLEGNSRYYNYSLSINGTREVHYDNPETDYLTNVIRRRALEFLQQPTEPFFMMVSTPACHAPFDAEPKYSQNFTEMKVPRTPNFNIANDDTKHWLLRMGEQPLSKDIVDKIDEIYRKRLRTLLTVDDLVGDIYDTLQRKQLLDNTYIIFTSDNGYHLGQFSLPLDKREPYEFDIRVPLVFTGPGITPSSVEYPTSNIDLAPTFLDIAGINIPKYYDGISLKYLFSSAKSKNMIPNPSYKYSVRRTVLVEHTGEYIKENYGCEDLGAGLHGCNPNFACKCEDSKNNTYFCLRHIGQGENNIFCFWDETSFEEYYNLNNDAYQLNNTIKLLYPDRHRKLRIYLKNYKKCRSTRCQKWARFVL